MAREHLTCSRWFTSVFVTYLLVGREVAFVCVARDSSPVGLPYIVCRPIFVARFVPHRASTPRVLFIPSPSSAGATLFALVGVRQCLICHVGYSPSRRLTLYYFSSESPRGSPTIWLCPPYGCSSRGMTSSRASCVGLVRYLTPPSLSLASMAPPSLTAKNGPLSQARAR